MKQTKRFLYFLPLYSFNPQTFRDGKTIPVVDGNVTGNGNTATYTSGKLVFKVITGTTRSVTQGVQQPYEITVATVIDKPEDMNKECTVYPDPADGTLSLVIRPFEDDNIRFRLYDNNGALLQDKKIEDKEIAISMDHLPSEIYLMIVLKDNAGVRVFKIFKK